MLFTLTRTETSDQGTFGTISGEGQILHTAELPWRQNLSKISCIPPGSYICRPYSSPRFPNAYEVRNVPGRSAILIHSGNYAGDTAKGYRSDVEGCILLGLGRGMLNGQEVVISSRDALSRFRALVGQNSFELVVVDKTRRGA